VSWLGYLEAWRGFDSNPPCLLEGPFASVPAMEGGVDSGLLLKQNCIGETPTATVGKNPTPGC
jgi:hypothetical protein